MEDNQWRRGVELARLYRELAEEEGDSERQDRLLLKAEVLADELRRGVEFPRSP
jgi:hypothetical protein